MLFGSGGWVGPITAERREDSWCENISEPCVWAACVLAEWKRAVWIWNCILYCWGSGAELYKDKCCIKSGEMTEERFSVENDFQQRRRIMPLLCPFMCTDGRRESKAFCHFGNKDHLNDLQNSNRHMDTCWGACEAAKKRSVLVWFR